MTLGNACLLAVIGLTFFAINGCSTRTIETIKVIPVVDVEVGQLVEINTLKPINVEIYERPEIDVTSKTMAVVVTIQVVAKDSDSIKGNLENVHVPVSYSYSRKVINYKEDHVVEVKLEDIDFVRLRSKKVEISTEGDGETVILILCVLTLGLLCPR